MPATHVTHRPLVRYAALPVLMLALVLAAVLPSPGVSAQDDVEATGTPDVGVLGTPEAQLDCSTIAESPSAVYTVDAEQSEARYRVKEELASVGATEAVGTTAAIAGQFLVNADGLPIACSRVDVDLRTLTSDSARRDNYLFNNTLQTEDYPLATFVLTQVEGMDGALVEGEETTITLVGELTLHGVTNIVAWEATVTQDGATITGIATTAFQMPDFAITPPKAGPVLSLEERVVLEPDLTLTRA